MNNPQVDELLQILNPESSSVDIQRQCTKLISQKYQTIAEQVRVHFLISNVYYKILGKLPLAQKILNRLLKKQLNDKQKVECIARLAFMSLFSNQLSEAKQYHNQAIYFIEQSLDNQKKALQYVLLWVYCGCKNPSSDNPNFNLILATNQFTKNKQHALTLLKKIQKIESNIDLGFIKWKIEQNNQMSFNQKHKKSSQFQQFDKTLKHIFKVFSQISYQQIEKDLIGQKIRYLPHLKSIYNKYKDYQQYAEQLNFLQDQISHLEQDSIPLSLFGTINFKKQQINTNQIPNINSSSKNLNSNISIPNTSAITNNPSTSNKNFPQYFNNQSQISSTQKFNKQQSSTNMNLNFRPQGIYKRPPSSWQGSVLIKLNYTTDGHKIKFFYLQDPDKKKLYYCQRKDKPDLKFDYYYDISSIIELVQGKQTKPFFRKSNEHYQSGLCFSIILSNKSRDFIALNKLDYNYWIYTLKRFISHDESYISSSSPIKDYESNTSSIIKKTNFGFGSVSMLRK